MKLKCIYFPLFVLVFLGSMGRVSGDCNLAKYQQWKSQLYTGPLVADSEFWRYQTQPDFLLTNFLATQLAVESCVRYFDLMYYYLAGRNGPVDIQTSYKTMCKSTCVESDALHQSAMEFSGCSCLELSTQESDSSYHLEGDFCRENSARLLCDKIGYCGVWDCRIDDFMCPRYEWNKKLIQFKGLGTCDRGSAPPAAAVKSMLNMLIVTIVTLAVGWNML
jgi:hypothetical protein